MVPTGRLQPLSSPHLGWRLGYRCHQSRLYQTDTLTGAALICLWIFLPEVWPFSAERDRERKIEREGGCDVPGENAVGAGETESSHQAWLVTMGMLYIVIHFLSTFPPFLFWDDPMREEKC